MFLLEIAFLESDLNLNYEDSKMCKKDLSKNLKR